jgi:ATP-binding cassette, subfamily B, bacterial
VSESPDVPMPGALATIWRSLRLAYQAEPKLLLAEGAVAGLAAVLDGVFALWLALLAHSLVSHELWLLCGVVAGMAASVVGGWLLQTLSSRLERNLRLKVRIALEARVADLQASVPGLEHHERPEYRDRLTVLRDGVTQLGMIYGEIFGTFSAVLRLAITVGLLVSVDPLMSLLVIFAIPPLGVSPWRTGIQQRAEEKVIKHRRLADHLFDIGTQASAAQELQLTLAGPRVQELRRRAWESWQRPTARARWATAWWVAGSWAVFGLAYVGAVALAIYGLHAPASEVVLVLAAGSRLTQHVGMTAGAAGALRLWLDASRRLAWLEDYAQAQQDRARGPAPGHLGTGIRFENVSFRYPGTDRWVLRDVSVALPAGTVVAIVGDNGAGKTTMVKLLSRFYEPAEGRITVDGVDLSTISAEAWRSRLSGAFQDFSRFEFTAKVSIGLGELARAEDSAAVAAAIDRAGAWDVIAGLPDGAGTQLGATWPGGVDLSVGQWQRIAVARGLMREHPLLLILDEPTSALDAETEHYLFERFAGQAHSGNHENGQITILVSHRFSTVRMADLIMVVQDSGIAEFGSHDELIALGGIYAELYQLQARAYQ